MIVAAALAAMPGAGADHAAAGARRQIRPDAAERGRRDARTGAVTSTDVVYDLGSGDGRIPITAARKYGARGVGIEIDTFTFALPVDNRAKAGVGDRVTFVNQDLFEADISPATVVTMFLHPRLNQQLIPKLKRELRPGRGSCRISTTWATSGRPSRRGTSTA